ncbi:hypothetical protein UQ19_24830 [Escherichia coli]|nr:hypothetical protein UQ19_24830 [Escherichia coli]
MTRPGGGIIRRKKTIAPDTAPPLTQRKNSRFRAVNMLTGCPGIFAVFIFIIPVSYTYIRAHETREGLVCSHLAEKKKMSLYIS